jgi:hypothetical protein
MLAHLVLAATIVVNVPDLTHDSLERLMSRYISLVQPTITLRFGSLTADDRQLAFVRAGLARVANTEDTCRGRLRVYKPGRSLLALARHRGWTLKGYEHGTLDIVIPVGSFAYISNSAEMRTKHDDYAYIFARYHFLPNRNAKTLAFFAPPDSWGLSKEEEMALPSLYARSTGEDSAGITLLEIWKDAGGWGMDVPGAAVRPEQACANP